MKTFLRLLPHPLIPVEDFFAHFLASTQIVREDYRLAFLGSLVKILPIERQALLVYLCEFFFEIINHSSENKMGSSNLSIIFAPSFFGQSITTDSLRIIEEAKATSRIMQTLIENYPTIFKVCYIENVFFSFILIVSFRMIMTPLKY